MLWIEKWTYFSRETDFNSLQYRHGQELSYTEEEYTALKKIDNSINISI